MMKTSSCLLTFWYLNKFLPNNGNMFKTLSFNIRYDMLRIFALKKSNRNKLKFKFT